MPAASHIALMNIKMLYYANFTHSFIDICLAKVAAKEEQQYYLYKTRDLSIFQNKQTKNKLTRTLQTNKQKPQNNNTNKTEIS